MMWILCSCGCGKRIGVARDALTHGLYSARCALECGGGGGAERARPRDIRAYERAYEVRLAPSAGSIQLIGDVTDTSNSVPLEHAIDESLTLDERRAFPWMRHRVFGPERSLYIDLCMCPCRREVSRTTFHLPIACVHAPHPRMRTACVDAGRVRSPLAGPTRELVPNRREERRVAA